VRQGVTITRKEAFGALMSVFEERKGGGFADAPNEDYFLGCCDRWSMVIQELSRYQDTGRILDIGAHEGFLCGAWLSLAIRRRPWTLNPT
jgi:hypothetical protein